ncbi:MAG TPA: glycosyltransferase [Acidimicrobiales bacterium]
MTARSDARRNVRAVQQDRVDRGDAPGSVRLSVVVPAYEEGEQVGVAVRGLRAALAEVADDGGLEIVVVDDGSGDATADIARAAGADQVLALPRNRGKGAAVRTGMLAARGKTVAYTDADLAYRPEQIVGLLDRVEEGWDMVVGSRRHVDTTTLVRARRLREVTGRVFNVLTSMVLLGQYRDTQCGLKAFRSDVAKILFSKQRLDGFAFDVELFHLAERYELSLAEVPVTLSNSSRSTVRVVQAATTMVRDLARVRLWAGSGLYDLTPDEERVLTRAAREGS